mmetsp:Transcript_6519/g.18194  ORF Transcript_6519/g.18194 Transcript_6519/m.18194 type:complete len:242 (+) Transcript_6519:872-1597(+)
MIHLSASLDHIQPPGCHTSCLDSLICDCPCFRAFLFPPANLLPVHLAAGYRVQPVVDCPSCLNVLFGHQVCGFKCKGLVLRSHHSSLGVRPLWQKHMLDGTGLDKVNAAIHCPARLNRPINVVSLLWANEITASKLLMPQLAIFNHIQASIMGEHILDLVVNDAPLVRADNLSPTNGFMVHIAALEHVQPAIVTHKCPLNVGIHYAPLAWALKIASIDMVMPHQSIFHKVDTILVGEHCLG